MIDWVELSAAPLVVGQATEFVQSSSAGAIAMFLGTSRAQDGAGGPLLALDYEAYEEMALCQLRGLCEQARHRWPVCKLVILHRTGRVLIGEASVVTAVSTPHRADAFAACQWLIDSLKSQAAIWKKEIFAQESSACPTPRPNDDVIDEMFCPPGVCIAPMVMSDYPDVIAFWQSQSGVGLNSSDLPVPMAAYFARNPNLSLIARDGRQIIGAILCGHDGRRGYLHHLAVAESHRGRGIGKRLVNRCVAALAQIGIDKCNVFVYSDNAAGRAFWLAVGFDPRQDLAILQRPVQQPSPD